MTRHRPVLSLATTASVLSLAAGCAGDTVKEQVVVGCEDMTVIYSDGDGDGYGDASVADAACEIPEGWVVESGDCDDDNAAVNPGIAETCNGLDDNCDGEVDVGASDMLTGYLDSDGDGYGDAATASSRCELLADEVTEAGDCDDADAEVSPEGEDICGERDRNCDGEIDACPDDGWTRDDADLAWTGQAEHDATGHAIAVIEGAGGDTIVVGAPEFDVTGSGNHGAAYIATGAASAALADGGWYFGEAAGDHFGAAVANLGVLDASDWPIVAVAAPEAEVDGLPAAGAVYLFASLPSVADGPTMASTADGMLLGPAAYVGAGTDIIPAGDTNGDGFADFLVAAGHGDGSGLRRGEVWLLQGNLAGFYGDHELDDHPRWEGLADFDGLGDGHGIGAGDFDGDGLSDIALGASHHDRAGKGDERIGGVWVVDGREPEFPGSNSVDDAGAFIEGVIGEDETWFGAALTSPGDLDGDGYDELAVGGPWYDQEEDGPEAGAVWIFRGSLDGMSTTTADSADVTVLGEASWDWFGGSLAPSPDLDGDGSPELLVGADAADPSGAHSAGAVYVVPGALADGVVEAGDLALRITGSAVGDRMGRTMAAADVDGDGMTDVLVGAPGADEVGGVVGFLGVSIPTD